jgi:hypothetical protein
MRKATMVLGLALGIAMTAAVAVVAVGSRTRAEAITAPRVIKFVAIRTSFTAVPAKVAGPVGDEAIVTERLVWQGKQIGHDFVKCTTMTKRFDFQCHTTYVLDGGMITIQGMVSPPFKHWASAVTGGTGIYQNVRGELLVTPQQHGTYEEFHLIP